MRKSELFKTAWATARTAQANFGGSVKMYFSESLKMAWAFIKKGVSKMFKIADPQDAGKMIYEVEGDINEFKNIAHISHTCWTMADELNYKWQMVGNFADAKDFVAKVDYAFYNGQIMQFNGTKFVAI